MNYLVFIPNGLNSPELEILLSKCQLIIDQKKKLEIIISPGFRDYACSKNIFSQKIISSISNKIVKKGISLLRGEFKVRKIHKISNYEKIIKKINFNNMDKLKNFKFENIDFGNSVFSSYAGLSRDAEFEGLLRSYSCKRLLMTSLNIYSFFKEKVKLNKDLNIILYNGRHNETRPIVRLCEKEKISFSIMEYSGTGENDIGIREFKNHLPTDINKVEKLIKNFCKKKSSKINKCDYFFTYKKAGRVINDKASYILKQNKKLLPHNWNNKNTNIVYFTSSQDEYSCHGGIYDQTIYKNQKESLYKIKNSFKKKYKFNKDYCLYIRCHPYLEKVFWKYNSDIFKLHEPQKNIYVIRPASKISSYKLLMKADKVISYNSLMGIEAVYWQKPSILLGRRPYENLNVVYKPKNHLDVMELIFKKNLIWLIWMV